MNDAGELVGGGPRRRLTYDQIPERVLGAGAAADVQRVRTFVKDLHQKLGDHASSPVWVFTQPRYRPWGQRPKDPDKTVSESERAEAVVALRAVSDLPLCAGLTLKGTLQPIRRLVHLERLVGLALLLCVQEGGGGALSVIFGYERVTGAQNGPSTADDGHEAAVGCFDHSCSQL